MLRVEGLDELKAAVLLYKRAPAEIRRGIQREARSWSPTLVRAARARAKGPNEQRIASSGKVAVTAKGIVARFGSTGSTGRGAPLNRVARPYEFGTTRQNVKKKYLGRNPDTKRAQVINRRTQKQVPGRKENGRFIYPAVADATPALVGRYVRVLAKAVTDG